MRPHKEDYSKPVSHIPWIIKPYMGRPVPEPVMVNTPRIDQVMQDGKIMLSLNDAISLALENNLDLAIARYNLDIADTDVLRAKAGSSTRGVASGLVQGTPGGGVGGFGSGGFRRGSRRNHHRHRRSRHRRKRIGPIHGGLLGPFPRSTRSSAHSQPESTPLSRFRTA